MTQPSPSTPWYQQAFDEDYLERYSHRNSEEAREAVDLILRHAKVPAGARVFDLCCGPGRHLTQMSEKIDATLFGGDLSAALLARAQSRNPNANLVRLDMRHLPWGDDAFDLVTNFFTAFGYFDNDEENFGVFQEVARTLKPGGYFFFDFLNAHRVIAESASGPTEESIDSDEGYRKVVHRRISSDGKRIKKDETYISGEEVLREIHESVRLFTNEELERSLRSLGFEVVYKFGDYSGSAYDPATSSRLILISKLQ